jgi:hypothetical protein
MMGITVVVRNGMHVGTLKSCRLASAAASMKQSWRRNWQLAAVFGTVASQRLNMQKSQLHVCGACLLLPVHTHSANPPGLSDVAFQM